MCDVWVASLDEYSATLWLYTFGTEAVPIREVHQLGDDHSQSVNTIDYYGYENSILFFLDLKQLVDLLQGLRNRSASCVCAGGVQGRLLPNTFKSHPSAQAT